jgi:hypothetical protein
MAPKTSQFPEEAALSLSCVASNKQLQVCGTVFCFLIVSVIALGVHEQTLSKQRRPPLPQPLLVLPIGGIMADHQLLRGVREIGLDEVEAVVDHHVVGDGVGGLDDVPLEGPLTDGAQEPLRALNARTLMAAGETPI